MNELHQFREKGYAVVPAENLNVLNKLRAQIFEAARRIFSHPGEDIESFFNHFHESGISGTRLNELRVKLIHECTEAIDSGSLIFQSFRSTILDLLGPDLLVQRNTNLVIQPPHDPFPSETHRDAPANSPYEVVVWLPLVNCYGTKSMYMLDRAMTTRALAVLDDPKGGYGSYENFCLEHAPNVDVPYGTALMFWTGCIHGSRVNQESETRWSLNMRYKNLFSPNGAKEPFEFFKILQLSPLAECGITFQKETILK